MLLITNALYVHKQLSFGAKLLSEHSTALCIQAAKALTRLFNSPDNFTHQNLVCWGICLFNFSQVKVWKEALAIRRIFSLVVMVTKTQFSKCSNVLKIGLFR